MSEPMKYDDLDYTPTHGEVEIRHGNKCWQIPVNIECGRDMEAEGMTVYWPYAVIPAGVADAGFASIFTPLYRLFSWPTRWLKK